MNNLYTHNRLFIVVTFLSIALVGSMSAQSGTGCLCTNCPQFMPDFFTGNFNVNIVGATNATLGANGQGVCGVNLTFDHEYIGDLSIVLTSPGGQSVTLVGPIGLTGQTNGSVWNIGFVPSSQTPVPDPGFTPTFSNSQTWGLNGTYTGTYHPNSGQLENFNTGPVNGTWTLTVTDGQSADVGNLTNYEIVFCDQAGISCFSCGANAGNLLQADVTECQNAPGLNLSLPPTYGSAVTPPPAAQYSYRYVIAGAGGVVLAYSTTPNLSTYPAGSYTVCGMSIATATLGSLPPPNGIMTITSLGALLNSTASPVCAKLTSNCVNVTILPLLPASMDTSIVLCPNQSFNFYGTTFTFNQGATAPGVQYSVLIPNVGCRKITVLKYTPGTTIRTENLCQGLGATTPGFGDITSAGTFTRIFPNFLGCDSTVTLTTSILTTTFSLGVLNQATCTAQGIINASGNSGGIYTWTASNGGTIVGSTSGSFINYSTSGTYILTFCKTASPGVNCCRTDSIIVTVSGGAPITGTTPLCAGASATYTQTGATGGAWSVTPVAAGSITSAGVFTSSASYFGPATITYTVNSCPSNLPITINQKVEPSFSAGTTTYCAGSTISPLPTTSTNVPSITGTWAPAINNTTTTTYIFTPAAGVCADTASRKITITPKTEPTFAQLGPLCNGAIPIPTLPTTSTNSIAGTWSPATVSNAATGTYTFTPNVGVCADTTTMVISVGAPVTPTFAPVVQYCVGATIPALPTSSTNTPAITGTWAPAINNTDTTTYTFTPTLGLCANTTTMTINVGAPITPTFTQVASFCAGATIPALPTSSTNTPAITGTWAPAINNTDTTTYTFTTTVGLCAGTTTMTINVAAKVTPTFADRGPFCSGSTIAAWPTSSTDVPAITGTWAPAISNTVTTTYTFTPAAAACANTTTKTIIITPKIEPTFTQIASICNGAIPIPTLPTTSNNGITGTWNPATVSNTATGTYIFTPTAGLCADTASMIITVGAPVIPTFAAAAQYCVGATIPALPTSSTNTVPITGTWAPAINNQDTTIYTFTSTAGLCATTTMLTINVGAPITPTFTQVASFCAGANIPALPTSSTNTPAITGTWAPAINNADTTTYTFTPTLGLCASTTTMTINVAAKVTPNFADRGPFCAGTAIVAWPVLSTNTPPITGTWAPAINNNATTTYTFTPAAAACANTTTKTITILGLPTITVDTSCAGGVNTGAIATTATAGEGGTLSYTVNGTADTDGDQTALANGTYTVIVTEAPSGCTATETVNVNCACPTIGVAGATTMCKASAATNYTQSGGATSGAWSVTPAGAGTITAAGAFTPNATFSGAATITYTVNGCVGSLNIDIFDLPTITVDTSCAGGVNTGAITTTAAAGEGGTLSYTVNGTADTDGDQTGLANGTYTVIVTETPSGCTASGTVIISCDCPLIVVDGPSTICNSGTGFDTATYTQTIGPSGGFWSVIPDTAGTITPQGVFTPNPNYNGPIQIVCTVGNCIGFLDVAVVAPPTLIATAFCQGGPGTGAINCTATAGAGGSLTYSPFQNQTGLPDGSYTITVTESPSGCTDTETVFVNCNCLPIIVSGASTICAGTTATYLQTGGAPVGTWQISPTIAGTINSSGVFSSSASFIGVVVITYADPNGCIGTTQVLVNAQLAPTFPSSVPYCAGAAIPPLPTTSSNVPPITGTWSPSINNLATTTYTFTPTTGQCALIATQTIIINNPPILNIDTSCAGGANSGVITTVAFPGENGLLTITVNGTPDADGNQTDLPNGSYTVIVTESPSGCTASETVVINCNCPTLTTSNFVQVCAGNNTTYTISFDVAGGTLPYSAIGGTFTGGTFVSDPIASGTSYNIIVTDASGCSATPVSGSYNCDCTTNAGQLNLTPISVCQGMTVTILQNINPTLDADDVKGYILLNTPVFSVSTYASHLFGINYTEPVFPYFPNMSLNTTYYAFSIVGNGNANGELIYTDPCLSVSTPVEVRWIATPTAAISGGQSICIGNSATLQVIATGIYPLNVVVNDNLGNTQTVIVNDNLGTDLTVSPTQTATYSIGSVEMTTAPMCIGQGNIATATITVSPSATATVQPTAEICNNTIYGSTVDFSTFITAGDATGTWTNVSNTGNGTLPNLDFDGVAAGTYTFTYTTAAAVAPCTNPTYTLTLTVNNCLCPPVSLNAAPNMCNSAASFNLSTLIANAAAGTWSIIASPAGSTASVIGSNLAIANTTTGTYSLSYSLTSVPPTGCPAADTVSFLVSEAPNAGTANADASLCLGTTTLVNLADLITNAGAGGIWSKSTQNPAGGAFNANAGTFQTQTAALGTHTFYYTITGVAPCASDTVGVNVIIQPNPTVNVGSGGELNCSVQSLSLGSGNIQPNITYQWYVDGDVIPGANTATYSATNGGVYDLQVTNDLTGCTAIAQAVVTEGADKPVIDTAIVSQTGCAGKEKGFIQLKVSGGQLPINISVNGGNYENYTTFANLSPAIYTFVAEDALGCESAPYTTEIVQIPELLVTLGPDISVALGDPVQLDAQISIAQAALDTIKWSYLSDSTGVNNLQQIFEAENSRIYEIIVVDENGCTATDQILVLVDKTINIYAPSIFSPESNNSNANFMLFAGKGVEKIVSLGIYDRWGEQLYNRTDIEPGDFSKGWDGKFNTKPMSPGVYVYVAQILLTSGEIRTITGDVTLYR